MSSISDRMKKYGALGYTLCIAHCVLLLSCSGPKMIPDSAMEGIITEILLTEGVLSSGQKLNSNERIDSIDFYSPVLNKHGYTIIDFRHTINAMAARKSNPLEGIMERVVSTIDIQAGIAHYRYGISQRFDSLALAAYSDTIYKNDTIIIGSLKKFRIELDSIKEGNYRMLMNYKSSIDFQFPQKSMRYYFAKTGEKKPYEQSVWLSRSEETKKFDEVFKAARNRDSLVIYFSQITLPKQKGRKEPTAKDSSRIDSIAIIYTPPLDEARKRYYYRQFGDDFILNSDLLNKNEQIFKKDSLPGPLGQLE